MKKQEKQKQKIKEVLLKILHIVSYVLSLAFIGLCILTGVQSCSKPNGQGQKVNRDLSTYNIMANDLSSSFAYSYTSKLTGTSSEVALSVQENLLRSLTSDYSVYTEIQSSSRPSTLKYNLSLEGVYGLQQSTNKFVIINRAIIEYSSFLHIGGTFYSYRLSDIYLEYEYTEAFGYCYKVEQSQDGSGYANKNYNFDWWPNGVYNKFYCSTEQLDNAFFVNFFNEEKLSPVGFSFNDKINYNAPFGYLGKNPLIPKSKWDELPHLEGALEIAYIDTCWFLCNGQLYNRILLYGHDAHSYYYHFGDNLLQYTLDHNLKFVEFIAFSNTLTDYSNRLWVWSREVSSDYQGKYIIEDNGIWKSALYRNITLLAPSDTDLITFTQFNTDLDLYEGGITFYDNNVGIGSAFTLLRQAFTSLIDIMGISILPGITLGVFIFLPLIVTIIVLIFKAVRK